jgi:hypothetical protein
MAVERGLVMVFHAVIIGFLLYLFMCYICLWYMGWGSVPWLQKTGAL